MKQSKTDKTRAHIIAATAPIFNKKGYAGTSITDLTNATKLTSGSIYGNFAGKEEVALAALDHNIACFMNNLHNVVNRGKTTKDRLLLYIKAFHSSSNKESVDGGCPMQNALCDADDTMEPLRKKAADGLLLWKQGIVTVIEKGIAEGVFKADTDAGKTALHIIALCEFGVTMYSATQSNKQTDEIIEVAIDVAKNIMVAP